MLSLLMICEIAPRGAEFNEIVPKNFLAIQSFVFGS